MTIATDIICGFPNESEEDFQETLDLIDHYKLAIVNISQFYPRPGTPAAKMKRVPTNIVKDRSRRLTKLFESFTPYEDLVGKCVKVWFGTEISEDGHHSVGHTKAYVKVIVPYDSSLPGTCKMVELQSSHRFHVEGVISNDQSEVIATPVGFHYRKDYDHRVEDDSCCEGGGCSCGDGECGTSNKVKIQSTNNWKLVLITTMFFAGAAFLRSFERK